MVGHMPLEHGILVRVQVPQHGTSETIWSVAGSKRLSLRLGREDLEYVARSLRVRYERCTVHVMEEMRSAPSPAAKT